MSCRASRRTDRQRSGSEQARSPSWVPWNLLLHRIESARGGLRNYGTIVTSTSLTSLLGSQSRASSICPTSSPSVIASPPLPDSWSRASRTRRARGAEVPREPARGEIRHLVERAGFLEEVRGAGDDFELDMGAHLPHRLSIELDHRLVVATDDEER